MIFLSIYEKLRLNDEIYNDDLIIISYLVFKYALFDLCDLKGLRTSANIRIVDRR